ncbi:MAG TPA: aminotransferase class IV, partial [Candidatus Sulfotelmatobacter sp.]|nr:aminotransferase class IV [Candidatus Sulfotelmatobacter sp.]
GFGVYESLRVRNGIIYFIEQHAERLVHSAEIIGLEHPYITAQIVAYIRDLVKKNDAQNCNIKILLIGGKAASDTFLFILPLQPLFPDRKLYSQGATVETVHYRRFLPNAKTLNMLPSYLAYSKAQKHGHYDVLLLDDDDTILEGTRTNFFAIKGKTLITAPKATVLEGVVRHAVMIIAQKNGFTVQEEKIFFKDLFAFDGAFITSTSSKIVPLRQIDTFQLEIPQIVRELMQYYDAFLDSCNGVFPEKE